MSEKPLSAKDLKMKISDLQKEIERAQTVVTDLENLPLIHENLQTKVSGLARVIAYLEGLLARVREEPSAEKAIEILERDRTDLLSRNQPKQA